MTSIITGDIINSRKQDSTDWLTGLKAIFNTIGASPQVWEIYRGDEFQIEIIDPSLSLHYALLIKSYLRSINLDARMAIGVGDKNHTAQSISESNGSAFVHSGVLFETLKKQKINLAIATADDSLNDELNLMLQLSLSFMDFWLVQSAEFTFISLKNPELSQEEIGRLLEINQAAVSRRKSRAKFDLVLALDNYFRKKIKLYNV
jgi:hypothetical protein